MSKLQDDTKRNRERVRESAADCMKKLVSERGEKSDGYLLYVHVDVYHGAVDWDQSCLW